MPTGQIIANGVLTKLGLTDPSGSSSASDSSYVLQELNALWDAASIDEGLIYALIAEQFPLTAYQQSYGLGSGVGADWTAQVPSRIYRASVVDSVAFTGTTQSSKTILVANTAGLYLGMRLISTPTNGVAPNTTILGIVANTSIALSYATTLGASGVSLVATGLNRNPLEVVDEAEYLSHNDLGATATTPDEIYPKFNPDASGNIRVYVFPVVNENKPSYVELEIAVPFTIWSLGGNYFVPPGYLDWLTWMVAFRCLPGFGTAVNPQVAQVVTTEATKAEANIRTANAKNRQLEPGEVMPPGARESAALAAASQGGKGQ